MGKWLWIGVLILVGVAGGGVVRAQDPLWTCEGGQHDILYAAQAAYDTGDYATARDLASLALTLCEADSPQWQAAYDLQRRASRPNTAPPTPLPFDEATYTQARTLLAAQDYAAAIALLEQVLPTADDPTTERSIQLALGDAYLALGDDATALTYYEAALLLSQTLDDPASAARILHSFATIYDRQDRTSEAASAYAAEATAWEAVGDSTAARDAHLAAGHRYKEDGYYALAVAELEAALPDLPQVSRQFDARIDLAVAYWYLEDYEAAIDALQPALALATTDQNYAYQILILNVLSGIYLNQGNLEAALTTAQESLALAESHPETNMSTVSIYYQLGWVYRHLEDYPAAIAALSTALDLTRRTNAPDGEMILLRDIGLMYGFQGDYDAAVSYFEQAQALAQLLGDSASEATLTTLIREVNDLRNAALNP